jgi:hypothetical protein
VTIRRIFRRAGDPFDEAYLEARYGDAFDLLSEVEKLEEKAN